MNLIDSLANDGFGNWLAGFADGEGCFVIQAVGKTSHKAWFRIKLRDDDEPILREIFKRTNLGIIWKRNNGISKPQAEWIVRTKLDCQKLVQVFESFPLRAKKRRDFDIWKQAVLLQAGVSHYNLNRRGSERHPNQAKIAVLKTALHSIRKYPSAI